MTTPDMIALAVINDSRTYNERVARQLAGAGAGVYYRELCRAELAKPIYSKTGPVPTPGTVAETSATLALKEALGDLASAHPNLKEAARECIATYLSFHPGYTREIWRTETVVLAAQIVADHMAAHVKEL